MCMVQPMPTRAFLVLGDQAGGRNVTAPPDHAVVGPDEVDIEAAVAGQMDVGMNEAQDAGKRIDMLVHRVDWGSTDTFPFCIEGVA